MNSRLSTASLSFRKKYGGIKTSRAFIPPCDAGFGANSSRTGPFVIFHAKRGTLGVLYRHFNRTISIMQDIFLILRHFLYLKYP
ncbi:hypothetical protein CVV65_06225 [Kyrpidia spormannii]|uniref:Uncharacterized protein n=1 Tax=Kyrpidia spormannii TaxID=2055160 RepID=A0A2K8N5K5_9BACL|nr:hypothetical protein CVV65_06225 [Kyrpidia spormannii]